MAGRDRMHRQGVEDIKGKMPPGGGRPKQPRRKLSMAELREQAEAALRSLRYARSLGSSKHPMRRQH